jgi:predicted amidohydrolase
MTTRFTAACIQMTTGDDIATNIAQLEPLLNEAHAKGATLIVTPENTFYMRREGTMQMDPIATQEHPGVVFTQQWAKHHGAWVILGSIRAKVPGTEKAANRQVVIDPQGHIVATYDKLYLFDVTINDKEFFESSQFTSGDDAVVVRTDMVGHIGLSICYDIRFPHLYRHMALQGANMFTTPAAFMKHTGEAHWHILQRARAIENASFVLAAGQCGQHPGKRESYGHSLIIDPWGTIIAEASADTPEVITAEIDLGVAEKIRHKIPVLAHHHEKWGVQITDAASAEDGYII